MIMGAKSSAAGGRTEVMDKLAFLSCCVEKKKELRKGNELKQ